MINYSIIIPFRDKFDLMQKAVLSVADRNDIQILLVYNGFALFQEELLPKMGFARVELISSDPNKGAGHARNVGLLHAVGKYVLFLDSDDYFASDAFMHFDEYLGYENDIVFFCPTSEKLGSGEISFRHQTYLSYLNAYFTHKKDDYLRYRWDGPICKLFLLSFIKNKNLSFEEVRCSNDVMFSTISGHLAASIMVDPSIVYVITEGAPGQSLIKTRDVESLRCRYQVAIRKNKFLKEIGHYDMHIRLLGSLKSALLEVGIFEFFNFIHIAITNRISVF